MASIERTSTSRLAQPNAELAEEDEADIRAPSSLSAIDAVTKSGITCVWTLLRRVSCGHRRHTSP